MSELFCSSLSWDLIIQLNRKTSDNHDSVLEFKYKILKKVQVDSPDSSQKVNLVIDETTVFVEQSNQLKHGMKFLMALVVIGVVAELTFFCDAAKRNLIALRG